MNTERADRLLFVGTHGNVRAVDRESGSDVWTTSLPNTGYNIVSLLYQDDTLYAGAAGHVFALDPGTGEILWHNGLEGLGYGHMVLATIRQAVDPAALIAQLDSQRAAAGGAATAGA